MAVRTLPDPTLPDPAVSTRRRQGEADEIGALGPVFRLGSRVAPIGLAIGLSIGITTHAAASARALALGDLRHWWRDSYKETKDYFFATYEVDVEPPKDDKPQEKAPEPEPEPEKEPEKIPEKEAVPLPKPEEDPYKDAPPPKPAEAAQIQTAPENAQQPLDGFEMQSGKNPDGQINGKTANDGTGKEVVKSPNASTTGTPGGKGNTPGATGTTAGGGGADKSRPPTLSGSKSWNCPFPAEADAEGRDNATAQVVVTVRSDGSPQSVSVVSDPGSGFGRAARQCALGRRYTPALDKGGNPTVGTTPPISVRFTR